MFEARAGGTRYPPSVPPEELELDLDALSRSPDGVRRVTVTARGLFLERHLRLQASEEEHFDPERGWELPRWSHDTAWGGLALDGATVRGWKGGRVLDVGSGLSVVATELTALGISVDTIDLEVDADHPSWPAVTQVVRARYASEMDRLRSLAGTGPRYALPDDALAILDALRAADVASHFPGLDGVRRRDDATTLAGVDDDAYDATLCGWLFVHLEPEAERAAIASMLRVTRPGGTVHLCAGYAATAAERVAGWFPAVTIVSARGSTVVLRAP